MSHFVLTLVFKLVADLNQTEDFFGLVTLTGSHRKTLNSKYWLNLLTDMNFYQACISTRLKEDCYGDLDPIFREPGLVLKTNDLVS